MSTDKPRLAIFSVTPGANEQALRLSKLLACDCYTSEKLKAEGFLVFEGSMANTVKMAFSQYDALLFICATGIAVRMIAPLVMDKLYDPAVLVMDEKAKHVISLLSGHIGGGNALAEQIAGLLHATPVITTATDVNDKAALDILIQEVGAKVSDYRQEIKDINQMLVSNQNVGLFLDGVTVSDTKGFTLLESLDAIPDGLDALVVVSPYSLGSISGYEKSVIHVVPKNIVVGMGCRRDTPYEQIYQLLLAHLSRNNIDIRAIGKIGSVSIKRDEKGLIQLAQELNVDFEIFDIDVLKQYEHLFEASEFVRKTIGIGSVSQPSAWLMSQGKLIGDTLKQGGVTITLGVSECCI